MRKFIITVLPVFALLVVVGWLATGCFITGLLCVVAGSVLVAILMMWLTFVENHFDD